MNGTYGQAYVPTSPDKTLAAGRAAKGGEILWIHYNLPSQETVFFCPWNYSLEVGTYAMYSIHNHHGQWQLWYYSGSQLLTGMVSVDVEPVKAELSSSRIC